MASWNVFASDRTDILPPICLNSLSQFLLFWSFILCIPLPPTLCACALSCSALFCCNEHHLKIESSLDWSHSPSLIIVCSSYGVFKQRCFPRILNASYYRWSPPALRPLQLFRHVPFHCCCCCCCGGVPECLSVCLLSSLWRWEIWDRPAVTWSDSERVDRLREHATSQPFYLHSWHRGPSGQRPRPPSHSLLQCCANRYVFATGKVSNIDCKPFHRKDTKHVKRSRFTLACIFFYITVEHYLQGLFLAETTSSPGYDAN